MNRLRHSPRGYIRSLQMSRSQLFAVVEGVEADSYFYGEMCSRVCGPRGIGYRVLLAQEFQGGQGKSAVIDIYKYMREQNKLFSILNGKKTQFVFFVDKDVDEIVRKKCRSPNIIYTAYYDVQNHIFKYANFIQALSSAASIDPKELSEKALFKGNWCLSAAQRWKEWTTLCLFSKKYKIFRANYGAKSQINKPLYGSADMAEYAKVLNEIKQLSGLPASQFDMKMKRINKLVDKHMSLATHDIVFKGKWYALFLEHDLKSAFAGRTFKNIATRAEAAMVATLDFSQPWTEHFTKPLSNLVDRL